MGKDWNKDSFMSVEQGVGGAGPTDTGETLHDDVCIMGIRVSWWWWCRGDKLEPRVQPTWHEG